LPHDALIFHFCFSAFSLSLFLFFLPSLPSLFLLLCFMFAFILLFTATFDTFSLMPDCLPPTARLHSITISSPAHLPPDHPTVMRLIQHPLRLTRYAAVSLSIFDCRLAASFFFHAATSRLLFDIHATPFFVPTLRYFHLCFAAICAR